MWNQCRSNARTRNACFNDEDDTRQSTGRMVWYMPGHWLSSEHPSIPSNSDPRLATDAQPVHVDNNRLSMYEISCLLVLHCTAADNGSVMISASDGAPSSSRVHETTTATAEITTFTYSRRCRPAPGATGIISAGTYSSDSSIIISTSSTHHAPICLMFLTPQFSPCDSAVG